MDANHDKVVESGSRGGRGPVRTICVFCGSRRGNRPSFSAAASTSESSWSRGSSIWSTAAAAAA
ncbi:hypothetical protein EE612_019846 [Oryza sativa]|nr:hypothetical protein EE612_019846 [Oryza sativa]